MDYLKNAGSFECDNEKYNELYKSAIAYINKNDGLEEKDCILDTYWKYLQAGDMAVVGNNYAACKEYFDGKKAEFPEKIDTVETAFLFADASILASFAEILGLGEEQTEMMAVSETIKEKYNEKLLIMSETEGAWCYRDTVAAADDAEGMFVITPAAQALPLYWGIVPPENQVDVEKAFKSVINKNTLEESDDDVKPYIIQIMSEMEMVDAVCDYYLNGHYGDEMKPRVLKWIYEEMAGIELMVPGGRHVCIKPFLPEHVHYMNSSYRTSFGEVSIELREEEDSINVKITCPDTIHCMFDRTWLEMKGKKLTFKR